ncbi:MAG: hypothetical protein MUE94_03685 [Verrucomicrobia bacterium]|jgi:hypothetical protein|nr:hypothetical protein [Verrucomicrobiota bacterium]
MQLKTIRLRPDQAAFIAQVISERATDLSSFVRLCVDHSALAVAQSIPRRMQLTKAAPPNIPGMVSMRTLQTARRKSAQARSERRGA